MQRLYPKSEEPQRIDNPLAGLGTLTSSGYRIGVIVLWIEPFTKNNQSHVIPNGGSISN